MSSPAIELVHVRKSFGSVQAVRDVTLSVDPGEVIAFLGPNGAGKTTSISMMLGLRRPTSGEVRLLGLDPRDPRARSQAGVMLQESGVPPMLRVRELVDLFRSYYPAPLPADDAIRRAGLATKASVMVSALSGGQRQRLYYALAICGDPEIIVLDEPSAGLDVEGRHEFWEQVRDFARSGRTIVLTTHYLEEADALATRVVVIHRGSVIADDAPAAIKRRATGKKVSFDSALPLAEADFHGLPVQSLEVLDHRATLITNTPETVLKTLFARGLAIRNLEVTGTSLEEAFVCLTQPEGNPT